MEAVKIGDIEMVVQESTVNQRRRAAAEWLGVDEERVELHRLHLAQMKEAGLLIDLDIHGTSQFTVRASYAEMGISADDVRTERLRAGTKDLFPGYSKRLRSLETRARANLAKYSFNVSAFGGWLWLPWTAYPSWREGHDLIVAELDAVKTELLDAYDDIAEQNRQYFAEVGGRAWKALLSGYVPGDKVVIVTTDGQAFEDRDRFIEYVVQRALSKMPLPGEIDATLRIDYRTSILASADEVEAESAAIAQARAAVAEAHARQAEAHRAEHQAELQVWVQKSEAEAQIEAFRKAELEHARRQLAQMGSPIDEALDGLRANLYDAVANLLAGIRKNGGFRGQASTKAADLYAYWKQLNGNLLQDAGLDSALAGLDAEMKRYSGAPKEHRDAQIGDITSQLAEIAALTAESARKIANAGQSRAAALEL